MEKSELRVAAATIKQYACKEDVNRKEIAAVHTNTCPRDGNSPYCASSLALVFSGVFTWAQGQEPGISSDHPRAADPEVAGVSVSLDPHRGRPCLGTTNINTVHLACAAMSIALCTSPAGVAITAKISCISRCLDRPI